MKKSLSGGLIVAAAVALMLAGAVQASGQQKPSAYPYTDAWLTTLNVNTAYPCGNPGDTPSDQINKTFQQISHFNGGGTSDWTCYLTPISIDSDIFSPVTAFIIIDLPENTVTVNANAVIRNNFMICGGPGSSIVAGVGFTLTNHAQPCFGGGGGSAVPGGTPTQVQYNDFGVFGGVAGSIVVPPQLAGGGGTSFNGVGIGEPTAPVVTYTGAAGTIAYQYGYQVLFNNAAAQGTFQGSGVACSATGGLGGGNACHIQTFAVPGSSGCVIFRYSASDLTHPSGWLNAASPILCGNTFDDTGVVSDGFAGTTGDTSADLASPQALFGPAQSTLDPFVDEYFFTLYGPPEPPVLVTRNGDTNPNPALSIEASALTNMELIGQGIVTSAPYNSYGINILSVISPLGLSEAVAKPLQVQSVNYSSQVDADAFNVKILSPNNYDPSLTPFGHIWGLWIDAQCLVVHCPPNVWAATSSQGIVDWGDWEGFGSDSLANLQADIVSGYVYREGLSKNCSDCDTPPYAGAICTNSGDNAGAVATYIQGHLYCTGKTNGVGSSIANTYTGGLQDFTLASDLYVPAATGATGTHYSDFLYDLTDNNYHGYNGADAIFAVFAGGLNPGNGDCPEWINSSGYISLGDTGSPCGSGGGGTGTVTSVTVGDLTGLFASHVATGSTTPAITYTANSVAQGSVLAGPASGGPGAWSFQTAPTISAANMFDFPTFNQATTAASGGITGFTTPTPAGSARITQTVFAGTKALSTASINPGGPCNVDTVPAPGVVSTDTVYATTNADIRGVVGYQPSGPILTFYPIVPSADTLTIAVCNGFSNPLPIAPGAVTLNLEVTR
jgi:hypothetical protein